MEIRKRQICESAWSQNRTREHFKNPRRQDRNEVVLANPRPMHVHANARFAGNSYESAGKAVATAMKVAAKSAGNLQPARIHEDLHDLHARFFQKNGMFQKRELCMASQRSNIRHE